MITGRNLWAHWMLSDNFGDRIAPWLIDRLTGRRPVWCDAPDVEKVMLSGSILNHARRNTAVWGSGLASITDRVLNEGVRLHAVRGPLTRAIVQAWGVPCPEVYGDPALLAPAFVTWNPMPPEIERKIAVVYHYVDGFRAHEWWRDREDIMLVDPFSPVEEFCRLIASARCVVSSSLHGLIVADAYSIPRVWARFSDSLFGDGTKFRDHDMAVGLATQEAVDLRNATPNQSFVGLPWRAVSDQVIAWMCRRLLTACPFEVTDEARRLVCDL